MIYSTEIDSYVFDNNDCICKFWKYIIGEVLY